MILSDKIYSPEDFDIHFSSALLSLREICLSLTVFESAARYPNCIEIAGTLLYRSLDSTDINLVDITTLPRRRDDLGGFTALFPQLEEYGGYNFNQVRSYRCGLYLKNDPYGTVTGYTLSGESGLPRRFDVYDFTEHVIVNGHVFNLDDGRNMRVVPGKYRVPYMLKDDITTLLCDSLRTVPVKDWRDIHTSLRSDSHFDRTLVVGYKRDGRVIPRFLYRYCKLLSAMRQWLFCHYYWSPYTLYPAVELLTSDIGERRARLIIPDVYDMAHQKTQSITRTGECDLDYFRAL